MSVADSPDWQRLVVITSGGGLTDAPDWQRVVTGPGANPVPGVIGHQFYNMPNAFFLTTTPTTVLTTSSLAVGAYVMTLSCWLSIFNADVGTVAVIAGTATVGTTLPWVGVTATPGTTNNTYMPSNTVPVTVSVAGTLIVQAFVRNTNDSVEINHEPPITTGSGLSILGPL